jgi:chitodextrinase
MLSLTCFAQYEVTPLPFNTSYADEVAAVPINGGLLYCSNRPQSMLLSRTDMSGEHLFQIYVAYRKDSIQWEPPHILNRNLREKSHIGPSSLSVDGNTLYFTVNNSRDNGIYIARKTQTSWGKIRPFAYNSPKYKTAHPSLSRDEQRLFFASDMPGGFGGFDIYCCKWTGNGWASPENLGAEVNTPADELYPFIQGNGTLYFSSSGHGSMGGLDIFSVQETEGEWLMRRHPEAPINSPRDDFAYAAADDNGWEGYFSSNRAGKTVDMFAFNSLSRQVQQPLFPVFADCTEQKKNSYTYEFFEPGAIRLDTTTFYYEWNFGDGNIKRGEVVEHTYAAPGTYVVQLNVIDSLTGAFESRAADYRVEVRDAEQPYITAPETAAAGETINMDALKTNLPDMRIEDYYWMMGDGTQIKGESIRHAYPARGNYRIRLGVTGVSKETGEKVKICVFRDISIN